VTAVSVFTRQRSPPLPEEREELPPRVRHHVMIVGHTLVMAPPLGEGEGEPPPPSKRETGVAYPYPWVNIPRACRAQGRVRCVSPRTTTFLSQPTRGPNGAWFFVCLDVLFCLVFGTCLVVVVLCGTPHTLRARRPRLPWEVWLVVCKWGNVLAHAPPPTHTHTPRRGESLE
jgi:hypothetical protein